EPDKSAVLENAIARVLAQNLADAKPMLTRVELGRALGSVGGRPGTKCATRAAEALAAAIVDPQTVMELLPSFASALAIVNGQLPAKEASSHARKAADALEARWITKKNNHERATIALAMAEVGRHLSRLEKQKNARRLADDLEDAFQDAKTE